MKTICLSVAVLLAGCGGNGGEGVPLPPSPPAPEIDAFFQRVGQVVAIRPEDAEGANVDTVAPTAPNDLDPTPL